LGRFYPSGLQQRAKAKVGTLVHVGDYDLELFLKHCGPIGESGRFLRFRCLCPYRLSLDPRRVGCVPLLLRLLLRRAETSAELLKVNRAA
jgi:hypothetical protein